MSSARRTTVVLAIVGLLGVGAPSAATAAPRADTFSGTCTGLEGPAWFPEHPLVLTPIDMLLRVRLSGGECSGTLNGREVQSLPATVRVSLRGLQSCSGGVTSGRFTFELAGRRITGSETYRRVSSRITVVLEGDAGGSAAVLASARVGLVGQDHPLAGVPVVGPAISGPETTEDVLRRCAAEGITRMPIRLDRLTTLSPLSG